MAAGINSHVLELGVANLAQLKRGVDVAIKIELFLAHFNMLFWRNVDPMSHIWVDVLTIRVQIAKSSGNMSQNSMLK